MTETRTLSQIVLTEWAETGETSGLYALLDYLGERDELNGRLGQAVVDVWTEALSAETVRFFWRHAGYGYEPTTQTEEEGRFINACDLARAARWLDDKRDDEQVVVEWDVDDEYYEWSEDGRPLYTCQVTVSADGELETASLGGIDLGWDAVYDNPSQKVVEAELACEIIEQMKGDHQ